MTRTEITYLRIPLTVEFDEDGVARILVGGHDILPILDAGHFDEIQLRAFDQLERDGNEL